MRIRDPVCGMVLEWEEAVEYVVVDEQVFYFCCPACAQRFRDSPQDTRKPEPPDACNMPRRPLASPMTGSPRSVPVDAVPWIADRNLDEFEAALFRAWRRRLPQDSRARPECRTLERALLIQTLAPGNPERHRRSEVLTAAEIARLRAPRIDGNRIRAELRVLPEALEEALLETGLSTAQVSTCVQKARTFIEDVEHWLGQDRRELLRERGAGRGTS
ncbi:MAG: YHS domain-containing protein [Gemmatimonadota bacterium]|jgi:YHS domain-containing protein